MNKLESSLSLALNTSENAIATEKCKCSNLSFEIQRYLEKIIQLYYIETEFKFNLSISLKNYHVLFIAFFHRLFSII